MALTAGSRIGPYEIVGAIGAGGMGEVYRARDPRLGRDVAIKVLPSGLATDADRLRRFEQEARSAAGLNNAHILAVYDIGTDVSSGSPTPYIVSELLDGETLADRLKTGPLPVRKALDFGVQIAHGLAAAHEKGIVHRDLKPANLFVTSDGSAKILDFGLAKLVERGDAPAGASLVPTVAPDTLPGVVLGTVGYMSPEQVRGQQSDHRSDIFALGVVLYEMLSGRRAFSGQTTADTMTAILKEDPPDLPVAERHIPPALARIVDRCLEKNPANRFQSAGDLAFALDSLSSQSGAQTVATPTVALPRARGGLAWTVAAAATTALVVALALAGYLYASRRPPEAPRTARLSISLPEGWQLSLAGRQGTPTSLVMSPDGRRVAMVARRADGKDTILIRPLDSLTAQPLPGTEGVSSMFWSPDSRFVGFIADDKLKKIDVSGGPPTTLCEARSPGGGGTWSRNGTIVFSTLEPSRNAFTLKKVAESGGVPNDAVPPANDSQIRPSFLPDGQHFLFTGLSSAAAAGPTISAYIGSLDSSSRIELLKSGSTNVQYAQGHLLFLRDATLMAQPFDPVQLKTTGDIFPVADQIQRQGVQPPYGVFSASTDGVLVYQTGAMLAGGSQLTWIDRKGQPLNSIGDRAPYLGLSLSPDGSRAAVVVGADLWIMDLVRGVRTRFTFDPALDGFPVWSPDGSRIAWASARKGLVFDLFQKASNGTGVEEVLLANDVPKTPTDWSRDGRFILFTTGANNPDLWVLPLFGERKPFPVVATPFTEVFGAFSPDGRWVAYQSNESGIEEVYVIPFTGAPIDGGGAGGRVAGGKWQVSAGGGIAPMWRRDGKELFYFAINTGMAMAASVDGQGEAFSVGDVNPVFPVRLALGGQQAGPAYQVAPDGQRFLVARTEDIRRDAAPQPITVVLNWTAGIRK